MTSYTQYLFVLATDPETVPDAPAPPIPDEAGSWLCCFWKELADAMGGGVSEPLVPSWRGVDAVVDELFSHDVFKQTLGYATHIMQHFEVSYLPKTNAKFQEIWKKVIVSAWLRNVDLIRGTRDCECGCSSDEEDEDDEDDDVMTQ